MNRNTKARLNAAKKAKNKGEKSTSFEIPKIVSGVGERASWGTYGKKVINLAAQPRLSEKGHPKVAMAGNKNPNGPTMQEQAEIFYSPWLK